MTYIVTHTETRTVTNIVDEKSYDLDPAMDECDKYGKIRELEESQETSELIFDSGAAEVIHSVIVLPLDQS